MGLSNTQKFLLALSTFFVFVGTAGAAIPNFVPEDFRWQFAVIFWLLAIIGLGLQKAISIEQAQTP